MKSAISNNQSCADEGDYGENTDGPAHLYKRCWLNQRSFTHRGSCCYRTKSTKEQKESSNGKHGFAQESPLEPAVARANGIKIYSLEKVTL